MKMKIDYLAWVAITAVVWAIGSSGQLFAEPEPVGDYTLTVTGGKPSTDPKEAKVARGKTSIMNFVVILEEKTNTRSEETDSKIEKVIYTVTFINESNNISALKNTDVLQGGFEKQVSGNSVVHTRETDGKILSEIGAIMKNIRPGTNTATLSVTVYPEEGDSISASHEISVEGLGFSAFAYVKEGTLKQKRKREYVWNKIDTANTRMSIIGHATWKIEIPDDTPQSLLTSADRAAEWFKYNDKQVGFSMSDEFNDQKKIVEVLNLQRATGNFNTSAPGKLYADKIGVRKGQHGITLDEAKSGLKFIAEHFGRKKDLYGAQHNCVDMAVEGLNAAGVDRGEIGKIHIRVIYEDLDDIEHRDGQIDLSLPKNFGERYSTPD